MKTIFWNVDTQKDFMDADGALYVPGAEELKKNLEDLTKYAIIKCIRTVYSADAHLPFDQELKSGGGPFPDHCMEGTEGARFIPETEPANPIVIQNQYYDFNYLEKLVRGSWKKDIVIQKRANDVFTNPSAYKVINILSPDRIVVYGVATDYCVKDAVLGLSGWKGIEIYVVEDAIKAITEEGEKKYLKEMRAAGAKLVTTKQVIDGMFR